MEGLDRRGMRQLVSRKLQALGDLMMLRWEDRYGSG